MPHSLSPRGVTARAPQRSVALVCLGAALVCLVAPFALPASALAESFALPVDLEQGLVFGSDKPRTPYIFGARIAPSIDVDRARFGMVLAPLYRNPKWDFAVGARMSLFAPLAGKKFGARFEVQGEYLPVQRAGRVSIGSVFELFGLLRLGLWPAFDFDVMRPELCVSIGADVMSWAHVLRDDL